MERNKKYITTILSTLLTILLLAGCQTTIIKFDDSAAEETKPGVEQKEQKPISGQRYASLGLGIYELSQPQTTKCKRNKSIKYVKIEQDAIDALIHFFAGGVYSTRSVDVYCME